MSGIQEFNNILQSYFGSQSSFADSLFQQFLTENNINPNTPNVFQDQTLVANFVRFLQNTYDNLQTDNLSPDEVSRRQLVFTIFDIMVMLLETLQQNVSQLAQNVLFLEQYQEAYTTMQGRIANNFYIGGSTSLPNPDLDNLSNWTLGYGQLTMQDYINTAVNGITTSTNSNPTFPPLILQSIAALLPPTDQNDEVQGIGTAILKPGPDSSKLTNTLTISSTSNSITFEYTYVLVGTGPGGGTTYTAVPLPPIGGPPATITFSPGETTKEKLSEASLAFKLFLSSDIPGTNTTLYETMNNSQETLPGNSTPFIRYLTLPWSNWNDPNTNYDAVYVAAKNAFLDQQLAGDRAAKNSLLQQYVQNEQSLQQIEGNASDAQTNILQQTQTGISQGAQILNEVIQQMSTILTSIFTIAT